MSKKKKSSSYSPRTISEQVKAKGIARRGRINAIKEYSGLATQLVAGSACIVAGFFEALSPDVIPAQIEPAWALGMGLLIMGGKKVARVGKVMLQALEENPSEKEDS